MEEITVLSSPPPNTGSFKDSLGRLAPCMADLSFLLRPLETVSPGSFFFALGPRRASGLSTPELKG